MNLLQQSLVLDAIIKASLILAATAATATLLRRGSAAARHMVWTLGLLGALTAPALALALPRWEVPLVRFSVETPAIQASANRIAEFETARLRAHAVRPEPTSGGAEPTSSEESAAAPRQSLRVTTAGSARTLPQWPTLLLMLWTLGATILLGRVLVGLAAVQWMSRRTKVVADAPWLAQAHALARGLGISDVRFLRTAAASMPMAWGVFRPSVLMPADADAWPEDRLRIVLLHELAHVKRRDCLTHLFAQVACAAHWFNPLAWMAVRRLRAERERACDDLVLASGTRGSDYANQLLEIARVMQGGRFPAVLAGASLAMAHRSQLEGRLIAILDPSVPRRGLTRLRTFAATCVFAVLSIPVAAVQPWAEERAATRTAVDQDLPSGAPALRVATPTPTPAPLATPEPIPLPRVRTADETAERTAESAVQGAGEGVGHGVGRGVGQGVSTSVENAVASGVGSVVGGVVGGIVGGVVDGVTESVAGRGAQGEDRDRSRVNDPRTVAALIEALKDSDKEVRETALSALSQMRDPRVFEPLTAALKDAIASVRQQAAFGLGQLRDPRAVDALTAALKDSSADVREQAAFALGQIRARSAVGPLGAALKDTNADVREQAVFALGQIRDASAVDAITPALHDTNDSVREQAAFALGQLRDPRAVDPLISALKDEKPDVREQAAFALGQLRDARAVEALVIALKDANADVREQTAFALGQIRDARAIDGLTSALKDVNASVRQQAAFALGQIR